MQVFGNVISSMILGWLMMPQEIPFADQVFDTCGHLFVSKDRLSVEARNNLHPPPWNAYSAVLAIYICCSIVATLVVVLFLNGLRRDSVANNGDASGADEAPIADYGATWRKTAAAMRTWRPALLVPLTIFNGMEQAFIVGHYTKV